MPYNHTLPIIREYHTTDETTLGQIVLLNQGLISRVLEEPLIIILEPRHIGDAQPLLGKGNELRSNTFFLSGQLLFDPLSIFFHENMDVRFAFAKVEAIVRRNVVEASCHFSIYKYRY